MSVGLGVWDGITCAEWSRRHDLPLFEAHSSIGSTNNRLRELAAEGAKAFTVVVANEQTSGRGRGGKHWVSPPGGLWVSILTPVPQGRLGRMLPLLAGLAVSKAVTYVSGVETGLKWPNDILIGSEKLAGVLCEASPESRSEGPAARSGRDCVITGIGVNLREPDSGWPLDLVERPCALVDHLECPLPDLRATLLAGIVSELGGLVTSASPEDFRRRWSSLDALRDREVVCSMGVEGTARGIDEEGNLLVENPGGVVAVRAGSVRLRNPIDS
jgi:BirA family transcriptional regulator, biotin operon repressor / biotin---[acetyl-CoA-carboxylase] ligase